MISSETYYILGIGNATTQTAARTYTALGNITASNVKFEYDLDPVSLMLTLDGQADYDQLVTDEVCDGPKSIVYDVAENRLHVQKAIMALTMGKK